MSNIRKYVVTKPFKHYLPDKKDFEIVQEKIVPLKTGEFLVKAEYISVDPYMRSFAGGLKVPYDQFGFQIGKVVESKNSEYPEGSYVVSHSGWRDHAVLDGSGDEMFGVKPYKPEIGNLPLSLYVGAVGMPGITAYLGLLEICKPKQGDVICVTSAAGAVGSIVGQIAKLEGCTVIGFAGSDGKVDILKQELGFHHAFNYKTVKNIKESIMAIAPDGIDIYFDNVGGPLAASIMECMREHGRIAACGAISTYGRSVPRKKKPNTDVSVKLESFSFTQWEWVNQAAAMEQLRKWIEKGVIRAKETIANGFEELPLTLEAMLKGEYVGKAVVEV